MMATNHTKGTKGITGYRVVSDDRLTEMVHHVNQHIQHGWVPFGGVSVCDDGPDELAFSQAMVRTAPEPAEAEAGE